MISLFILSSYGLKANPGSEKLEQKYLKTAQGTWHYARSHSGSKALLFIHGANSSHRIWTHQFDLALEGYKSIFVDLLGYGSSDKPESGYSLSNWIQGIHHILEQEGVEEVCIVAHSNGVIFAKEYYRSHPEVVSHLFLLDGMLKQMIQAPVLEWMRSTLERSDYKTFMAGNVERMPVEGLDTSDIDILKQDALQTPKHVAKAEFELISHPDTWKPLVIQCPSIIVHANSPVWTEDYTSWLSSVVPEHQLLEWQDAGHFIQIQFPDRLNQLITEVLK